MPITIACLTASESAANATITALRGPEVAYQRLSAQFVELGTTNSVHRGAQGIPRVGAASAAATASLVNGLTGLGTI